MVKSENVSLFGGLSHLGPQPVINQSSASDAFNECSNNSSQEHQLEASHERSQQKNNPKKSGSFLNKLPKHQFFFVAPKTRCQAPKKVSVATESYSSRSIFNHLNGCPDVWNPLKKSPNLLVASAPFEKKGSTVAVILSNKVELMYITKLYYIMYIYIYYIYICTIKSTVSTHHWKF